MCAEINNLILQNLSVTSATFKSAFKPLLSKEGKWVVSQQAAHTLTSNFSWQFSVVDAMQVGRTALSRWTWNTSTSQIPGARATSSSSPNSTGQSTRPSDLRLSALARSSPAMRTFSTPMRKINGGSRGVTEFSSTHMATVSFQEDGERKMASVGRGNEIFYHYVARKNDIQTQCDMFWWLPPFQLSKFIRIGYLKTHWDLQWNLVSVYWSKVCTHNITYLQWLTPQRIGGVEELNLWTRSKGINQLKVELWFGTQ